MTINLMWFIVGALRIGMLRSEDLSQITFTVFVDGSIDDARFHVFDCFQTMLISTHPLLFDPLN